MNLRQKVLSVILSLVLALFTLVYIEKMGYGNDLQQYYFGGLTDMGQLEKFVGKSYFQGIKTVMSVVFIFFVAYICFFAFFFELIALAYFICTSKWRKPRVFISYKNATSESTVNTNKIALDIKTALENKRFRVLFFKYTTQLEHDNINFQIQMLLRKADAMIAIPDPYSPSYVNAEISCAVNSFKPVYIIKHTKDQKLPDTANSGHTVLLLDKLKKEKYDSLSYFLQYVHKLWHKRLYIIGLPLISFLYPFIYLDDDDGSAIKALLVFGLVTAGLVFFLAAISSHL